MDREGEWRREKQFGKEGKGQEAKELGEGKRKEAAKSKEGETSGGGGDGELKGRKR